MNSTELILTMHHIAKAILDEDFYEAIKSDAYLSPHAAVDRKDLQSLYHMVSLLNRYEDYLYHIKGILDATK